MPNRHYLAVALMSAGLTLETYGTIAGSPPIVSFGEFLIYLAKTLV